MKNVSFMQLVLGVTGGLLIYAGIKDVDLVAFFGMLVRNPKQAFNQGFPYVNQKPVQPSGNTTLPAPVAKPPQSV